MTNLPVQAIVYYNAIPKASGGRALGRGLISAVLLMILPFVLLLAYIAPAVPSDTYMLLATLLGFSIFFLQCFYKATGPKPVNWLTVDTLFILAFFCVHFVMPFSALLGLVRYGQWYNSATVNYSVMMSATGLIMYMLGFHTLSDGFVYSRWHLNLDISAIRKWKSVGTLVAVFGVCVVTAFMMIMGRSGLVEGEYTGTLRWGYGARVLFALSSILLGIGYLLMTLAAAQLSGKWSIGLIPKLLLVVFCGSVLLLGHRSMIIMLLLPVAIAYSEHIKAISFKMLIILFVAGTIGMGLVGVARTAKEKTLSSVLETVRSSERASWASGFLNIGGSANVLCCAVSAVPAYYPYFKGRLKVSELAGIIPFGRVLVPVVQERYSSSSYFITWVMYGNFKSGAGSTVIADIYVDFGFLGVMLGMYSLGLLSKYCQLKGRVSGSLIWSAANCWMASAMVIISRNAVIGNLIREVLWKVLLVVLIGWLLQIPKPVRDEEYALGFADNQEGGI